MSDKGVIIKEICNVLNVALDNAVKKKEKLDSNEWWTEQVMTRLCRWGLKKKWWVGAKGMHIREEMKKYAKKHGGTIGSEWLYDFTCLEYNDDGWLKGIPLVAECEWASVDHINEDFEKLLLARADVRIMIFNGNHYREGEKSISSDGLRDFRQYIKECEHTRPGDTYLFAARLHESEDRDGESVSVAHRFDYQIFVA